MHNVIPIITTLSAAEMADFDSIRTFGMLSNDPLTEVEVLSLPQPDADDGPAILTLRGESVSTTVPNGSANLAYRVKAGSAPELLWVDAAHDAQQGAQGIQGEPGTAVGPVLPVAADTLAADTLVETVIGACPVAGTVHFEVWFRAAGMAAHTSNNTTWTFKLYRLGVLLATRTLVSNSGGTGDVDPTVDPVRQVAGSYAVPKGAYATLTRSKGGSGVVTPAHFAAVVYD